MRHRHLEILGVAVALCFGIAMAPAGGTHSGGALKGTIDSIEKRASGTYFSVTLTGDADQPSGSNLTAPQPDPSSTTDLSSTTVKVVKGSPVQLYVERAGTTFTPTIGLVDSVADATHCTVKVDLSALEQTWQDSTDNNRSHKAEEYLQVGAKVTVLAVVTGTIKQNEGP